MTSFLLFKKGLKKLFGFFEAQESPERREQKKVSF
jgi:hypothetical protein